MTTAGALRNVRLVGLPLDLWHEAYAQSQDVELKLKSLREHQERTGVPQAVIEGSVAARYFAFQGAMAAQFAEVTAVPERELLSAIERGERFVDVAYRVSTSAAQATVDLLELLLELDRLADHGGSIIPPVSERVRTFRTWFLREFRGQLAGGQPLEWESYLSLHNAGGSPELSS